MVFNFNQSLKSYLIDYKKYFKITLIDFGSGRKTQQIPKTFYCLKISVSVKTIKTIKHPSPFPPKKAFSKNNFLPDDFFECYFSLTGCADSYIKFYDTSNLQHGFDRCESVFNVILKDVCDDMHIQQHV